MATEPAQRAVCQWCGLETSAGQATECAQCGAPLEVLAPLAVECGWCAAHNHREQVAECVRCGGPLPAMPGTVRGPEPPQPPRKLPRGYRLRVLLTKNVLSAIGAMGLLMGSVFVIVAGSLAPILIGLGLTLMGIVLSYRGYRRAKRWLRALVHGRATHGELTKIGLDRTQSINGVNPWHIEYDFEMVPETQTPGVRQKESGFVEAWDRSHEKREPGDAVWVVYDYLPDGTLVSAIWPPLH